MASSAWDCRCSGEVLKGNRAEEKTKRRGKTGHRVQDGDGSTKVKSKEGGMLQSQCGAQATCTDIQSTHWPTSWITAQVTFTSTIIEQINDQFSHPNILLPWSSPKFALWSLDSNQKNKDHYNPKDVPNMRCYNTSHFSKYGGLWPVCNALRSTWRS